MHTEYIALCFHDCA